MFVLVVAGSIACDVSAPMSADAGLRIAVASGDGQRAAAGAQLPLPLSVRVLAADGSHARGVRVRYELVARPRATEGAVDAIHGLPTRPALMDSVAVTGADGIAAVRAVAGPAGDTLVVIASIASVPAQAVRFVAVGMVGPVVLSVTPAAVRAGDTITVSGTGLGGGATIVRIGEARVPALGGGTDARVRAVVPACLAAGATTVGVETGGAQSNTSQVAYASSRLTLALQPLEYVTIPAEQLGSCVELPGAGATYLITAQFASAPAGTPAGAPALEPWRLGVSGVTAAAGAATGEGAALARARLSDGRGAVRWAFETHIRAVERTIAPQARSERRVAYAAARDASPPVRGSLRAFSVVSRADGSAFTTVNARLRFIGERILVYTDTLDAGYSAGQLQALSSLMDTHLWGTAVNAFGSESDVDANGRVIVLFTPVVNSLSPAADCIQRGYVTGFFYPIDQLERAPQSNRGEIFYALVPDSTARYSCEHDEGAAVRIVQGAFLHEMQHLISFNEHVLARGGPVEETWLNEGLSHVAEELGSRLFEQRYPPPLGRSTTAQLFPDSAAPFIGPLLLNAYLYLNTPLQHSVTAYDGPGSIEERGATWLFLRWLTHQKGDGVLRRLVQTSRTGVANVEAAGGERFNALFGDFSLALFADSLPGVPRQAVPSRLRFANRSIRQLMARQAVVAGFTVPFPLTTYLAPPGGTLRASMLAGTMLHAIIPGDPAVGALRLSFATPELAAFRPALGAQLGVMRLPE